MEGGPPNRTCGIQSEGAAKTDGDMKMMRHIRRYTVGVRRGQIDDWRLDDGDDNDDDDGSVMGDCRIRSGPGRGRMGMGKGI